MPLPNEHSCRLSDPDGFQEGSFRRIQRGKPGQTEADGRPLGIIIGRPKGQTTTKAQAYRYPIDEWTEKEAKAHCKKAGGEFHAATGKKEVGESGRKEMGDISLDSIRSAIYSALQPLSKPSDFYVKDIFADYAIVEAQGKLFKVPYNITDQGVEFGEMEEVRVEYVPVGKMRAFLAKILGAFKPARDEKAVWTVAYMNDLADSAFLWIEAGGEKDEDGKTVPRSLRHFPVKDAEGNFDLPHVRNAIARIPQAVDKNGDKLSDALIERLQAKATAILERMREKMSVSGFKVYEQSDGSLRWLDWTTNAFKDLESEIFETKALEEYAVRAMDTGRHGELWLGHIPVKVGTPDGHIVIGRFLVETGLFDGTEDGKKAGTFLAAYKDPLEMSHRYHYIQEDRKDGIYEWLDIVERSVLPAGTAANPWTSMATIEQEVKNMGQMPEKIVNFFKEALGEERWEQVKGNTEALTKALEAAGVEFKSLEPKVATETPSAPTPTEEAKATLAKIEDDVKALDAGFATKVDGIEKAIAELTTKVDSLAKTQEEKVKEQIQQETPRLTLFRASQSAETVVDKTKADKLVGPQLPKAVEQIAGKIQRESTGG